MMEKKRSIPLLYKVEQFPSERQKPDVYIGHVSMQALQIVKQPCHTWAVGARRMHASYLDLRAVCPATTVIAAAPLLRNMQQQEHPKVMRVWITAEFLEMLRICCEHCWLGLHCACVCLRLCVYADFVISAGKRYRLSSCRLLKS